MALVKNDIVSWKWKDKARQNFAPYGDYHCYSGMAVFNGTSLKDTYWFGYMTSDRSSLPIKDVKYTLLGNIDNLTEIKDDTKYYNPSDIIDMRHANASNAEIYLKSGKSRCAQAMLYAVTHEISSVERCIENDRQRLLRLNDHKSSIENGELEGIWF